MVIKKLILSIFFKQEVVEQGTESSISCKRKVYLGYEKVLILRDDDKGKQ